MKRVRCEQCETRYNYVMERQAEAGSRRPFGIGADDAARDVRSEARERLRRRLADEVDPVPCPECGRFQAEMVETMLEEDYGWVRLFPLWIALIGLIVVPVVAFLTFLFIKLGDGFVEYPILIPVVAVVYFLPFALIWFRGRSRRARYNPNESEPLKARLRYARRRARVIATESEPESEPVAERPRRRRRPIVDASDWRKEG